MTLGADERVAVITAMVAWLEKERVDAAEFLRTKGVALTKKVQRVLAERTHTYADRGGEWRLEKTHQEEEEVSALAALAVRYASIRWTPTTASPLAGHTAPESDGTREKRESLEQRLLGDYLTGLKQLTEPDTLLANRLANAYLDYLFAAEITEVEEMQIGGILPPTAPVASSTGMLLVRALTAEELGSNLRRMFGIDQSLTNDDLPPFGGLADVLYNFVDYAMGCMLTIRRKVPPSSALKQEPRLRQVALAFQLLGHSIFGRGVAPRWTEPGPRWGSAPELIHLPQFPEFEERPVTSDLLDEVTSLADLIPLTFAQPKHRGEVALNQFSGACAQKSDADAVIGFTIALETIFVPGLLGENAYRFRLNGARYLGANEQERHEVYMHLKKLYEVRSKLVHGAPPQESELRDTRMIARGLAARALSKALKGGWPTGKELENSALS